MQFFIILLSASYHKQLLMWNKWMKQEYVKNTFKFFNLSDTRNGLEQFGGAV